MGQQAGQGKHGGCSGGEGSRSDRKASGWMVCAVQKERTTLKSLGITFFALLSFPPPTPSATGREINPFDNLPPIQPSPVSRHNDTPPAQPTGTPGSPFPMSLTASTDLCLSLESMRGRKFLQVRGVTELPADEVLEGQEDGAEVQMSISPGSPLLCAYFSGLLCRQPKLSAVGRTLTAVIVGLGDEGFGAPCPDYEEIR